jgi:hypothetical protein
MRLFATLFVSVVISLSTASAQIVPSPSPDAMPHCDGVLLLLRVSEIPPSGSVEMFMTAVAAQRAWYRAHGLGDEIFASRSMVQDPVTHAYAFSDKEVLTYHFYYAENAWQPKHDASWDDFVKLYRATSTIKQATLTCVAKVMAPPMK